MKILLSTAFLFLLTFSFARASHMAGSDIEYQFTGKDTIRIILRVYRDCTGIPINDTPQITITPLSGGQAARSLTLTRKKLSVVHSMCPGQKNICEGGSFPYGMEENLFDTTLDLNSLWSGGLNSSCCKLNIAYQECCRNTNVTNINPGNYYIDAEVDRCIQPYNASPKFQNPPFAIVCLGQGSWFNNGATDTIDHDSLSFELTDPLNGPGTPESFVNGFHKERPFNFLGFPNTGIPFPGGLHFDNVTGDFGFTTSGQQQPVVAFKISEWRKINGTYQLIGMTRRDVQFYTYQCPPNNPAVLSVNGNTNGPWAFNVCAGNSICVNLQATDKDTTSSKMDTTLLSWNNGIQGATFVNTNAPNKIVRWDQATMCWTPAAIHASSLPYYFTVKAEDNHCPAPNSSTRAISILVKGYPPYKKTTYQLSPFKFAWKSEAVNANDPGDPIPAIEWKISKTPDGIYNDSNTDLYTGDSIVHTFDSTQTGRYVMRMSVQHGCNTLNYFDTITIGPSASIKKLDEAGIRVYPNPASQQITIDLPEKSAYEIELFSYTGQVLQTQRIYHADKASFQRNALPSGIYLLKVTDVKGNVWTKRIRFD